MARLEVFEDWQLINHLRKYLEDLRNGREEPYQQWEHDYTDGTADMCEISYDTSTQQLTFNVANNINVVIHKNTCQAVFEQHRATLLILLDTILD